MYQKGNKELLILGLYLGDYSKKIYLRELCRLSEIPLKTVQRTLENLEMARILRSEVHGKNKYFSLNLENIETKSMLMHAEISRTLIFLEKYPVFKTFLKEISSISAPIIVFGSFAKFVADKNSDIDLLIVSEKKIELPSYLVPNKIHEITIKEDDFIKASKTDELLVKKIRETHAILNNHSFFVNTMWEKYAR